MNEKQAKVLAVDDNEDALFALERMLVHHGYQVLTANSGRQALEIAAREVPDLILLDVMMPEMDGYEVTQKLKDDPNLKFIPIILVTAKDDLDDVVSGLNLGADDYIKKPFRQEEIIARLRAVLRTKKLYEELKTTQVQNRELSKQVAERSSFANIIGKSAGMREIFDMIEKLSESDVAVLIVGESGTGKELVARAIHFSSLRKNKPFMAQNCSAFNESILESELFGHVRGAFSGAISDKKGLFEVADGGTFFLDELGEMSPALQAKLLRVLQDGTFIPVGATQERKVNVRVVAATHRNLAEMIKQGKFREDLFYRLNVVKVNLPPLRERKEDLPLLIEHYLNTLCEKNKITRKQLSSEALQALLEYSWPGNVRQLANELERVIIMSGKTQEIVLDILSPEIKSGLKVASEFATAEGNLKEALNAVEREMILSALKKTKGNRSEAARVLGISRSNLLTKIQEYQIEVA